MTESEALTIMQQAFSCYDRRMRGICQKSDCDDCTLKEYNSETIHFAYEMIMRLLEKDDDKDSSRDIDKATRQTVRELTTVLIDGKYDVDAKSYLLGVLNLGDEITKGD